MLTGGAAPVRIAVVSDLHVAPPPEPGKQRPSNIVLGDGEGNPVQHPVTGLRHLVKQEGSEVDVLVCAGDMTNQGDRGGLNYAWNALQALAKDLKADLVATAGNHDLDSRYQATSHDPKGALQGLRDPYFPFGDREASDHYWARNYAIYRNNGLQVVTLNSSAYHGYVNPTQATKEHEHGRVTIDTIDFLLEDLGDANPSSVNVLLTHHHPQRIHRIDLDDYSDMINGPALLEALGQHGAWLVIHGHKHLPYLTLASGAAGAPVILSAGSLGAHPYSEAQGQTANQFYILDVYPPSSVAESQADFVGRFRAWDWRAGLGWKPAGPQSGLPAEGGFGSRVPPRQGAEQVKTYFGVNEPGTMSWSDALERWPWLHFALPADIGVLKSQLARGNIELSLDDCGRPHQLARRP